MKERENATKPDIAEALKNIGDKPIANIVTLGHVDHGKSTLSTVLSKCFGEKLSFDQIDKLPEEKRRGITIEVTSLSLQTRKRRYSLGDLPGHEKFIRNMLTGASIADIAILVIDSTAGAMEQTYEHIILVKQIGISHIVFFLNKVDLLSPEDRDDMLEVVRQQISEELEEGGYVLGNIDGDFSHNEKNFFFVEGSALKALEGKEEGVVALQKLMDILDAIPLPPREINKPFLMPISAGIPIAGRGIVAAGLVERGKLKVGDEVIIIGGKGEPKKDVITEIEIHRNKIKEASAGCNVGVLLRRAKKGDVKRGFILMHDDGSEHKTYQYIKCSLEFYHHHNDAGGKVIGRKTSIKTKVSSKEFAYSPQFFIRTLDIKGTIRRVKSLEGEEMNEVNPGDIVHALVEFDRKILIEKGLRFNVREAGRTIARGVIEGCGENAF